MSYDKINKSLDVEFDSDENSSNELIETKNNQTELIVPEPSDNDKQSKKEAEEDFQNSRKLINQSMTAAGNAITEMEKIAKTASDSRFFEVYSEALERFSKIAKESMELHQKKDQLTTFIDEKNEDTEHEKGSMNINNAIVFDGTVAEMQRYLKEKNIEDDESQ